MKRGKSITLLAVAVGGFALFSAGCSKTTDAKLTYESAINSYYKVHPICLWHETKKFPVQAATADDAKTEGYDALTDAGLLTRTTAEKKVFIIASKQVNNYDLSSQGRSDWAPDPNQPGYGNFCYGNRDVTSIDSYSNGTNGSGLPTAQVIYHYKIANLASWANSQEMRTAFPSLNQALSGPVEGQDSLIKSNGAWQVAKQ